MNGGKSRATDQVATHGWGSRRESIGGGGRESRGRSGQEMLLEIITGVSGRIVVNVKLVNVVDSSQAQAEIPLLRVSADLYLDNPGTDVVAKTVSSYFYLPLIAGILGFYSLKAWSSGKRTNRERDLHGRTILLTGASSTLGLTIISELARRGAQVIAIVPDLGDPAILSLIDLVRHTTNNELVYAEQCDLESPNAIKTFCAQLVKSSGGGLDRADPPRLDAVIFAHEYVHIGAWKGSKTEKENESARRLQGRLATFFFLTLLLPILLTAPQDRDIRFINVISPFYGAAIPSYNSKSQEETLTASIWIEEGRRSLKTILFTRHFQRILNALPSSTVQTRMSSSDDHPATSRSTNVDVQAEAVAAKRPSNIVAVAVSPGISRWDTVAPFMRADRDSPFYSVFGMLCYVSVLPFLYLFAKSSNAAAQSVLHALFLPSTLKTVGAPGSGSQQTSQKAEYVKGGALYAECEPVQLPGNFEERFANEEGGQLIWEYLERELALWRKSEDTTSADEKQSHIPKI